MWKAINKKTGLLIPAFKIEWDASWIGKEREEWIAPYPQIENWKFLKEKGINEVKVSFVKSYIREDGVKVRTHFRIVTEFAREIVNESEEHLLAKEGIYEDVIDNLLKINGKSIRDLFQIDDIDFEYHLSKSRFSKIADVIVTFKEKDVQYGKGIIFEVQLSNQTKENTDDRTYDRIIEGYSVVWLWDGMFNTNNKLKDKEVILIPYLKALEEYKEKKKEEFNEEINLYGNVIDKKIQEAKSELAKEKLILNNEFYKINNTVSLINESIKNEKNNLILSLKEKTILEIYPEIKKTLLDENSLKTLLTNSINYSYLADIISNKEISILKEKLQEKIQKEIDTEIKSKIKEEIINDSIKKILAKVEEKYANVKINVFTECEGCKNKFPVPMVMYDKGNPYCPKCFDALPTNWRKEHDEWSKNIQIPSQKRDKELWLK